MDIQIGFLYFVCQSNHNLGGTCLVELDLGGKLSKK